MHTLTDTPPHTHTHPHTHLTLSHPRILTDEAPGPPSNQIRWDLIAAGICGVVLLLAVVTVVGMATYVYRQKHKQRHRRLVPMKVLQDISHNGVCTRDQLS